MEKFKIFSLAFPLAFCSFKGAYKHGVSIKSEQKRTETNKPKETENPWDYLIFKQFQGF